MSALPIAPCPACTTGDLFAPADPTLDLCVDCLAHLVKETEDQRA
jgi:hypothetical protein